MHIGYSLRHIHDPVLSSLKMKDIRLLFLPPHVLMDFVVFPPGHGSSITDFLGWGAHEAQLRCPDDVSGDIGGWSSRRALKPKFY
jgi:hypothetical protein